MTFVHNPREEIHKRKLHAIESIKQGFTVTRALRKEVSTRDILT